MLTNDVILDALSRIKDGVHAAIKDLGEEQLTYRPSDDANSIAWLVWHLTRAQDSQVASAAGLSQVWTTDGWAEKFALPFDDSATGYGHSSEDVAKVQVGAELLAGYYDAVHASTEAYLQGLNEDDYAKVVDESWDPPVTLAMRLVSILNDDTQHVGQAAYVRGLLPR